MLQSPLCKSVHHNPHTSFHSSVQHRDKLMCINLIKPQNSLFVCLFTNKQTFSYGHSPNTCLCKKGRHPDFAEGEIQHENLVENITAACKKVVWPAAQECDDAGDGNDDEYEEESDEAEEDTILNHH